MSPADSSMPGQQQQAAGQEGLPADHPPAQVMEHVRHLTEEAEADPQNREARVELGNSYYDMGRFDAAVAWYEEALALDPEDINVSTDLGTSYLYLGQTDKALELYEKSLVLQPDHPQTLQNIGVAYFATEQYPKAVEYWQQLIEKHPDYPNAEQIKEQIEVARNRMEGNS